MSVRRASTQDERVRRRDYLEINREKRRQSRNRDVSSRPTSPLERERRTLVRRKPPPLGRFSLGRLKYLPGSPDDARKCIPDRRRKFRGASSTTTTTTTTVTVVLKPLREVFQTGICGRKKTVSSRRTLDVPLSQDFAGRRTSNIPSAGHFAQKLRRRFALLFPSSPSFPPPPSRSFPASVSRLPFSR